MAHQQPSQHPNSPAGSPQARPNDAGVIAVQAHFRIFDPKTQRTIVEGRA
jgi:hypothetical protein